jgi:hypothetical protein
MGNNQEIQPLTIEPRRLGLPAGPQAVASDVSDCLLRAGAHANVLAPAMQIDFLPPDHVISFAVLLFPIDGISTYRGQGGEMASKQQSNGIWYATDGGGLAMHRSALDMLAQAAGITWVHNECGRTDDRGEPFIWAYRMTCEIKGIDGRTRRVSREYELDLRGGDGGMSPAASKAGNGLRNARIHGAQLAESKASNRAVRAALGLRAYTVAEARRPFVIPVLRWVPDSSDPEIRRMIAAKELGVIGEIYGSARVDDTRVIDHDPRPARQEQVKPRQLPAPSDVPDGIEEQERRNRERQLVEQRQKAKAAERNFETGGEPWKEDAFKLDPVLDEYCKAMDWRAPSNQAQLNQLNGHLQGAGREDHQHWLATRGQE